MKSKYIFFEGNLPSRIPQILIIDLEFNDWDFVILALITFNNSTVM